MNLYPWTTRILATSLVAAWILTSCAPNPQITPTSTAIASATLTTAPTATSTNAPATETMQPIVSTSTQPPTAVPSNLKVCSPLENISLAQLPEIMQTPLQTPHPGQDDGHHGVDFAFYRFGAMTQMEGLPIHSSLEGTVAAVVSDRLPYGNMVIVETPLDKVPSSWLDALQMPTPSPAIKPDPRMQACPENPELKGNTSGRSFYLLYAHLRMPSPLRIGDSVGCGQPIGEVGNTGKSGNPHLHLEVRVGPSGARFSSMAYYDPRAVPEENANYCTWRISQLFQLMDPMKLLSIPQ